MSDKWVQASEITDYLYCRRAWWLKRARGYKSSNVRQLSDGTAYHQKHGRSVARAVWMQRLAYLLIFCLITFITFQVLMNQ